MSITGAPEKQVSTEYWNRHPKTTLSLIQVPVAVYAGQ